MIEDADLEAGDQAIHICHALAKERPSFLWTAAMTRLQELAVAVADNPLAELLDPPPLDDTYGALFLGMVLGLMCVRVFAT